MRTLSEPRLVPVVELPPYRFLNHIPMPDTCPRGEEWTRYWRASLAASGFTPLEPILPGSVFVEVEQLNTDGSLNAIISYEREQLDDAEVPLSLDGGYVLYDGEELVALPQCCAALKDLVDWRHVAEGGELYPDFWIGIGHPGLAVAREEGLIRFLPGGPEHDDVQPFFCEQRRLTPAVNSAQQQVERFRARLLVRAEALEVRRAADFCDGLVGKATEVDDGW